MELRAPAAPSLALVESSAEASVALPRRPQGAV